MPLLGMSAQPVYQTAAIVVHSFLEYMVACGTFPEQDMATSLAAVEASKEELPLCAVCVGRPSVRNQHANALLSPLSTPSYDLYAYGNEHILAHSSRSD